MHALESYLLKQIIQEMDVNLSSCTAQSEAATEFPSSAGIQEAGTQKAGIQEACTQASPSRMNVRIQGKPKSNIKGRLTGAIKPNY